MAGKQVSKKVVLIGDGAVGKTSLIRKFVFDKFDDKYITTIGTKVTKKQLSLTAGGEATDLTLMLWDILGQKGYHSIQSKSYAGAAGAILVCDLTVGIRSKVSRITGYQISVRSPGRFQ